MTRALVSMVALAFSISLSISPAALAQGGAAAGAAAKPEAAKEKPASPRGSVATQIGTSWIEIDYGRPILRARAGLFGRGADYGSKVSSGTPVWRVGANESTRLTTQVPLVIGGQKLPAGEYSLFVALKDGAWTLVVSSHKAKGATPTTDKTAIWGSYGYDAKLDVLRAPMKTTKGPHSVDQLSIRFLDVTAKGGTLEIAWDKEVATVDFTVGP